MQKFISKYGLAAHLAFLAVAPLFLSSACVLWFAGISVVWLFMEPSRIGGEHLGEARMRVVGALLKDPLTWTFAIVVLIVGIRALNGGIAMSYDAEAQAWSLSSPKYAILPGSVSGHGVSEFASLLALGFVVMGCRHALGRKGRLSFLFCASALSGAGAVTLAILLSLGAPAARTLLSCSQTSPLYLGSAMGIYWLAGTITTVAAYEAKWFKAMPLVLLCIGGNGAGLFLFAPPHVQVVFVAVELPVLVYSFHYALRRLTDGGEFKFLVTFVISVALAGVLVISVLPEALLSERLGPYVTGTFLPESFETVRKTLSGIAQKAWQANPWIGSGLGSYPLDLRFLSVEADWAHVTPEQIAPLNGYWYLLAERGMAGALLIACPLGFLLWSYGSGFVRGLKRGLPHPVAGLGLAAVVALLTESFVDVSFSLPGMMLATAAFLAISACSFPKENQNG